MFKMMHADFYRLWRTKSFFICTAVAAVIAILRVVIIQSSYNILKGVPSTQAGVKESMDLYSQMMKAGGIGQLATCMSGNLIPLLIAIVVSLFVCIEFTSGAIKNAHGFNRSEIYFSTLLTAAVSGLIMMLVYMLLSFSVGSIAWGVGTTDADTAVTLLKIIGIQALLILACTSLFVMVAMLMRNGGGTIAINLGSFIVVPLILGIIDALFNNAAHEKVVNLSQYWVANSGSLAATLRLKNDDIITCLIVAGCYIVIPSAIGAFTFEKRDIK